MELKAYTIRQYLQWLVPGGGGGGHLLCTQNAVQFSFLHIQLRDHLLEHWSPTVASWRQEGTCQPHTNRSRRAIPHWEHVTSSDQLVQLTSDSFSMVCTERDTRLSTSSFCFSFSLSSPQCLSEPLGPLNNPFSSCSHAKIRPLIVSLKLSCILFSPLPPSSSSLHPPLTSLSFSTCECVSACLCLGGRFLMK